MIKIKHTQSVEMLGDKDKVILAVFHANNSNGISIPMRAVFQVKRGLESYVQKFYRKHDKKIA